MQHIETDQFAQWRVVITGSICLRFLFALRYCLNASFFYPASGDTSCWSAYHDLTTNSCTLKRRQRNHHNHSNLAQINCVSDIHQTTTAILI